MRTLLVSLLVLGCNAEPSPADMDAGPFDGGAPDTSGGPGLCPPENIYLTCFTLDSDGCTPVSAESLVSGGCGITRCPEGTLEGDPRGTCGCTEATNCALDFVGCCGQCDAEPALVSHPRGALSQWNNTCEAVDCACEEERVAPYDQQIPTCEANVCGSVVIDRTCTTDEDCSLVHIPSGNEVCSQLDSINVSSESDFLAYHAESTSCELPEGAVARCDASLVCVVETAE